MKITNDMIDKELRIRGIFMKKIFKASSKDEYIKLSKKFNKLSNLSKGKVKEINVEERWIFDKKSNQKIRVCIYSPRNIRSEVPGILWLHGGGYSMGMPEQDVSMYRKLIQKRACIIVAPEYSLSIDKPYPKALMECYEVLLWMKENAKILGIKNNQIIVGGESAGGGLTAALSLYARDKKEVNIAFQMPIYPMIDDRMITESAKDNNAPVWNSALNRYAWEIYLGEFYGRDVPIYAAPARAKDYKKLPPMISFIGELDPFKDETIEYAENLKKEQIPVNFKIYNGCYHAFDNTCPKAKVSKLAIEFLMNSFDYAIDNYFAEQS